MSIISLIDWLINSLPTYTENENEKDNQVDVIEHSEKEISKENPEIDLASSKITDYFQLSPNKDKDTTKRSCKKQKIPIPSSKSQENSCITTLNENNDPVILLIFMKILRGFDFTEKVIWLQFI